MKTLKISTTIATLNLFLFMSVSAIANSFIGKTGEVDNKGGDNETESVKSTFVDVTSTIVSGNEFIHLRFDVNKFNTESGVEDLPIKSLDYLRFDASRYSDGTTPETNELPVMNQFDYLRFNVTEFQNRSDLSEMPVNEFAKLRFDVSDFNSASDLSEMPVNEFDYLRFDVTNFISTFDLSEMPVNEFDQLRFDVSKFNSTSDLSEMPVVEFDYLRFDVKDYSNENSGDKNELPVN